ncbi:hypothetical protein [Pseudoalteromonas sp. CAL260-MNA-CIBAN-0059]|uniref:hypothetical protein n=1 Tax=Pseudoalteromonas sp. CAL260-MNA-CIBAN-0059 TaxID=3140430 RepID=UPI00332922F3
MAKVVILCPANSVTGGPELLHQFAYELSQNNVDASILYYPYGDYKTADTYAEYNVDVVDYLSVKNGKHVFVFPEVATNLAYDFESKKKYIWWLSVDNYFKAYPKDLYSSLKFKIKAILNKKSVPIPMDNMKQYKHLSQSEYGLQFLKKHNVVEAFKLTDYLNDVHLNNFVNIKDKENIVAYNPKKGVAFTQALIQANPTIQFVPIQGMTAVQVGELLNKSKVYIDFGEHPGKDRIPREAAMARCVVITGKKGSAANDIDVPIPSEYKFTENDEAYFQIGQVINDIFTDFISHNNQFENYRTIIKSEYEEFSAQVKEFAKLL